MTIRTFYQSVIFILFNLLTLNLSANLGTTSLGTSTIESEFFCSGITEQVNSCPPVTNIQVEFLPNGKALIFWDAVPNIDKYLVKVVDQTGLVLINTLVLDNQLMINNLQVGMKYNVSICYYCPETGAKICATTKFEYVIIEEVIVMFNGQPCNCANSTEITGSCPTSLSDYYSLITSRIYNILLTDGTQLTFVADEGSVRLVGNCAMDFEALDVAAHGANNLPLPYYDMGTSHVFFHGTSFCVNGGSVSTIKYCELGNDGELKERSQESLILDGIHPNPFTNTLTIDLPATQNNSDVATVQIFDAFGILVFEQKFYDLSADNSTVQIKTNELPSGMYWLSIVQDGKLPATKRIVKIE